MSDDEAKACAAMRAALSELLGHQHNIKAWAGTMLRWKDQPGIDFSNEARLLIDHVTAWHETIVAALAIDAGKDWVPRAELEATRRGFELLQQLPNGERLELRDDGVRIAERERCAKIVLEEFREVGWGYLYETRDKAVHRILAEDGATPSAPRSPK